MLKLKLIFRATTAYILAPVMALTGFRFSKEYRHEVTRFKSFVYNCVDTVGANHIANGSFVNLYKYIF